MGGVLLDWNPRHLYRKLIPDAEDMEHFLATVTTTQWHGLQDQGGNPAEATRRLTADHPGKQALIEAFYGRFDEMLDHPFPQMADLVERLHRAGTPLYLLSNAPGFLDAWLRGPARRKHPFLGRFRDYVVSGHVGCCKPDATIYDLVCRIRERTGIAFGPHSFRHTYATELLRRKVPVEVVQHLLGHASIATTSDAYAHLKVEDTRRALVAAGWLADRDGSW